MPAFLLPLILLITACGGTEPPVSKNSDASVESVKTPASFTKVYAGILNNDSALMQLEAKDRILSGSYFYKGQTEQVILSGSLSENDSVRLEGIDAANKQMMVFNGIIKGNTFSGEWKQDKPLGQFSFTESTLEFAPEKYVVIDTLEYKWVDDENKKTKQLCVCKIRYPQIENPGKKTELNKINEDIKKNFIAIMDDCDGYGPTEDQTDYYENEAMGKVIFNNGEIVGVELAAYNTGGAHPNHSITTYYYDVTTGNAIKLIDLFQGANLQKVKALIVTQLKKQFKTNNLSSLGVDVALSGDESFYVTTSPDSVFQFHFSPYEIAPYAVGDIEVKFKFSEVKPLLSNRTAFSKVIK